MSKKIERLLILLLSLTFVFGLAACGDTTDTPTECPDGQVLVDDECIDEETNETDETAPVISGMREIKVGVDSTTVNYLDGITANDGVDGDITANITVDSSAVDLSTLGTYAVTLTISDAAGNSTTETFNVVVEPDYESVVKADLAAVVMPTTIDGNIDIPKWGDDGSWFYWSSSHPQYISTSGFVINPPLNSDPVDVTLTLRAESGGYSETKTFTYTLQPSPPITISGSKTVDFEGTSTEYVVQDVDDVKLFFAGGALPYIDIETYIDMVDGAIDSDIISYTPVGEDKLEVSYTSTWEDFDGTSVTETYTASIDFTLNTFTVDNFDFFEGYISSTESDYGEGLDYVDAYYVEGQQVLIPLGDYNIDIAIYDDNGTDLYLMPLSVVNLLFSGGIYYDVYYNGNQLYGIDTFGISGGSPDDEALLEEVRLSTYNQRDMPADIKMATYNYLALALDYFYGLKEERGIDTYYEILAPRAGYLLEANDADFYREIFKIANGLDDLHTSHVFPGYYESNTWGMGLSLSDLGSRVNDFYDGLFAVQDLLDEKYGTHAEDELPTMRLIDSGKTAVVYLYGFTIDSPDEFKTTLDSLPASVENVVIDLSYNTGGNIGAVLRIFGYMTDDQLLYHSQNPADGSAVTYHIESSYTPYEYNWYIISSSVTFSAANMMVSMAQELDIATVMGQPSSGGASSIGTIITPDGTCLLVSTNNVLSTRIGTTPETYEYISVESGIDVDYLMSNVTSDEEIISVIDRDQAN